MNIYHALAIGYAIEGDIVEENGEKYLLINGKKHKILEVKNIDDGSIDEED